MINRIGLISNTIINFKQITNKSKSRSQTYTHDDNFSKQLKPPKEITFNQLSNMVSNLTKDITPDNLQYLNTALLQINQLPTVCTTFGHIKKLATNLNIEELHVCKNRLELIQNCNNADFIIFIKILHSFLENLIYLHTIGNRLELSDIRYFSDILNTKITNYPDNILFTVKEFLIDNNTYQNTFISFSSTMTAIKVVSLTLMLESQTDDDHININKPLFLIYTLLNTSSSTSNNINFCPVTNLVIELKDIEAICQIENQIQKQIAAKMLLNIITSEHFAIPIDLIQQFVTTLREIYPFKITELITHQILSVSPPVTNNSQNRLFWQNAIKFAKSINQQQLDNLNMGNNLVLDDDVILKFTELYYNDENFRDVWVNINEMHPSRLFFELFSQRILSPHLETIIYTIQIIHTNLRAGNDKILTPEFLQTIYEENINNTWNNSYKKITSLIENVISYGFAPELIPLLNSLHRQFDSSVKLYQINYPTTLKIGN